MTAGPALRGNLRLLPPVQFSLVGVLKIGLTGGIASGKSVVASRLRELGAVLVDADALAREVVEPGTPGLAAVVEAFGPTSSTPTGGWTGPGWGPWSSATRTGWPC